MRTRQRAEYSKGIRNFFALFLVSLAGIVLSIGLLEGAVRYGIQKTWIQDLGRNWHYFENAYIGDNYECTFQQTLAVHPFFGWMQGPSLPCFSLIRNNRGFWDKRDIPYEKDPNFFTILLVGGSVAAQLAHGSNEIKDEVHWLEDELNRRFISPNKKPFRVLSGAASGWRMPTQIVSATLYGPNVDAVVSLDGYNEADSAHAKSSIHKPDSWTWSMVQNAENGKSLKLALKFLKTYRLFVKSTPVLRDSKALFFAYEGASKVLLSNEDLRQSQAPAAKFQFSYPAEFTESQINAANIEQWKSDLLALYGITQALGLRYLHFIQPIPKLYKTLTSEELNAGHWIDGEFYKKMIVAPAVSLKKNGYPTEPLTGIYLHVKDRVYFDPIHSSMAAKSLGYTLISQKMANHMAKYWKLKLKPK